MDSGHVKLLEIFKIIVHFVICTHRLIIRLFNRGVESKDRCFTFLGILPSIFANVERILWILCCLSSSLWWAFSLMLVLAYVLLEQSFTAVCYLSFFHNCCFILYCLMLSVSFLWCSIGNFLRAADKLFVSLLNVW